MKRVPAEHSAADEVCWWGDRTLLPHLWNFAKLPWIEARLTWGDPIRGENRKRLAIDLHAACMSLLAGDWDHGRLARILPIVGQRPALPSNRATATSSP
jgi:hypothetical protein